MPTHVATAPLAATERSPPARTETGLLIAAAMLVLLVTLAAAGIVTPPDFAVYGDPASGMMLIGP